MPAGHSRPPALTAARATRAVPARRPAFTSRAVSGLPGARAKAAPSSGSDGAVAFHGVSAVGSVARSTATPIMRGSVQAETSYGRTMSLPGTSFVSG